MGQFWVKVVWPTAVATFLEPLFAAEQRRGL